MEDGIMVANIHVKCVQSWWELLKLYKRKELRVSKNKYILLLQYEGNDSAFERKKEFPSRESKYKWKKHLFYSFIFLWMCGYKLGFRCFCFIYHHKYMYTIIIIIIIISCKLWLKLVMDDLARINID